VDDRGMMVVVARLDLLLVYHHLAVLRSSSSSVRRPRGHLLGSASHKIPFSRKRKCNLSRELQCFSHDDHLLFYHPEVLKTITNKLLISIPNTKKLISDVRSCSNILNLRASITVLLIPRTQNILSLYYQ
jgi:hypothetical protein